MPRGTGLACAEAELCRGNLPQRPADTRHKGGKSMNLVAVQTPMQYLDKAVGALRDVGLMPAKVEPAPSNALLEKVSDLEPEKVQVIARTLGQASVFNEVVREQISGM